MAHRTASRGVRSFQTFPWPTAHDEEWRRTDIRGLKLDAFAPPPRPARTFRPQSALDDALGSAQLALRHGHRTCQRHAARQADASKLGRSGLRRPATAVKDHPDLLQRYLLTEAVTPADDVFAALHCGVLDGRDAALRAEGREARCATVQPVGLAQRGAGRHEPYARRARRGGRGDPRSRDGGRDVAKRRRFMSGPSRSSWPQGRELRFVNIQNWDDATWHFSRERALVGRDAALAVDGRRPGSRLAKVNQEVALTGQGAEPRLMA